MSRIWILTAGKVTAEACTNYPSPPEREFATHKFATVGKCVSNSF